MHHDRTFCARAGLHKSRSGTIPAVFAAALIATGMTGCASVPGETLASHGERRDASARVLALAAQGHPKCKKTRIVDTQVEDVYSDGRVSEERWTVDRCGDRLDFRVGFPPKGHPGNVEVRAE